MVCLAKKDIFEGLQRVTSDKIIVGNTFNPDGLFSKEIFGGEHIPSCKLKCLRGMFYLGETCPNCKTKVSEQYGKNAAFIGVGAKILNPTVVNFFKTQGIDIIKMFDPKNKMLSLDGEYEYDDMDFISILELDRDIDGFIDKMETLGKLDEDFLVYLRENKENITMDKVYVLPISLRETQLNTSGAKLTVRSDPVNAYYVQMLSVSSNIEKYKELLTDDEVIENELFQFQSILDEMSEYIVKEVFSGKDGLFRGSILSNRINFSARAPITLLDDIKDPQTIHIPRDMFVEIYKLKLVNTLSHSRNCIYSEAERFLMLNRFDAQNVEINNAIQHIIERESLDTLINRNPSLTHNNLMYARVTAVHREATISLSKMFLKSLDGDIDGDTVALFTLDTIEAKRSAKLLYSLETLVNSPYRNGEISTEFLELYQDNLMGLYLCEEENFKHIDNN